METLLQPHQRIEVQRPDCIEGKESRHRWDGKTAQGEFGDDSTNGLTLLGTEGTSSLQETDPVFSSKLLGSDTVTGGLVKVSFEEFADSNFSLDNLIREYLGLRYARGIEKTVTLGTR